VRFNFTFIYTQDLNVDDIITIALPSFMFTSSNDEFPVASSRLQRDLTCWEKAGIPCWETRSEISGSYISKGSWHSTDNTQMLLTVTQVISAGSQISAIVSAGYGIQVPEKGLLKNSKNLRAKCTASAGSSDFEIIKTSPGVGGFVNLELDFDPPKIGDNSTLTVKFQPIMIMTPQDPADNLLIWLPQFTGTNNKCIVTPAPFQNACWKDDLCSARDSIEDCLEPSASQSYCQWVSCEAIDTSLVSKTTKCRGLQNQPTCNANSDCNWNSHPSCKQKNPGGASGVLVEVSKKISVHENIEIILNRSLGIYMPTNSLSANQASMRLSGSVKGLSVASVPFLNSPPVGAIYNARYSFDPTFADRPTALTVTFSTGMSIKQGETITLHLPQFNAGRNWQSRLAASVSSRFQFASWTQATHELVMTCMTNIGKGGSVTETVSTAVGLRLPAQGITFDSTDLEISCNAAAGPFSKRLLRNSTPSEHFKTHALILGSLANQARRSFCE